MHRIYLEKRIKINNSSAAFLFHENSKNKNEPLMINYLIPIGMFAYGKVTIKS